MTAAASPLELMEGSLRELLFLQLLSLGLFGDATFTAQGEQARIDRRFARWFDESLRILERGDYLRRDGASFVLGPRAPADGAWSAWETATAQWFDDPAFAAQARLVDAMVRALPDILTGKRLATELLFADASVGRVEGVYQGTTGADYFNAILAEVAAAYLEQRFAGAAAADAGQVRLLEVGAGTGGTSAALFARLEPYQARIAEYCYTDISRAFLAHAQQRYAPSVPYLTWKLFNAEKAPQEQGIDVGAYDLVVATNVLHATRDIRNTLRNVKAALQRNGLLLLNEMHVTGSSLLAHLTFGLTDGWWLFEDDPLRVPGTPALTPETWRAVLDAEGFEDVFFPAQAGHALGQQVIVARSDGVVQQPVRNARKPASAEPASAGTARAAKPRGGNDAAQRARISEALLERLCQVLKLDAGDVDVDAAFADYGLDSIVGIEFVKALNESLSLDLETTVIFDYSSITQLTSHILARYPGTAADAEPAPAVDAVAATPRRASADTVPAGAAAGRNGPIAVVGMSGRFARSRDLEELWQRLANGEDLVESSRRWGAVQPGDGRYPYGSFIDGIDEFDAPFFSISGAEASYMDPKQRLFLEEAWKALEDAGYAGAGIHDRRCGVYVGCEPGDYSQLFGADTPVQAMWGNATSIVPARIAYYLDLQGAAIAVDTACSSALVAVHLGCQALWNAELDLVIAGGVSIGCAPAAYGGPAAAGMLSGTGRCHTFDAQADGFVPGEGVGAVVLRRLDDALRDGDVLHGVIRGSGINQDGATNGITAPSARSQERLESQVYDTFGVHPDEIDLVEAHGTGTPLGDPIEINALTRAFRRKTARKRYCAIGTIKTNLGHALAASGMAGLFKVLLSLRHRQMPPSLHFHTPNPHIDLDDSPFFVNTTLREWPRGVDAAGAPRPRRAALSAFGMSGTNAHLVIEEAPVRERARVPRPHYLVVLSARSAEQLRTQAERLLAHAEREDDVALGDIACTLIAGRRHFTHRLACVVPDRAALRLALARWLSGTASESVCVGEFRDKSSRERPALKEYGQACLAACVDGGLPASEYRQKLEVLADLYVQGYALDFAALFADGGYARVSLPTYPFARQRYWVEAASAVPAAVPLGGARAMLHPLLHENTSDLYELRYSSTFDGSASPVERGELSGAAVLEMALAALELAGGWRVDESTTLSLAGVAWETALKIGPAPRRVHLGVYAQTETVAEFEIFTETDEGERVVHAHGRGERRPRSAAAWTHDDAVRVTLPVDATDGRDGELAALHPALLRQVLAAAQQRVAGSWVPQRLARFDVLAPVHSPGHALLHEWPRAADGSARFDIALMDERDRVCAVLSDFVLAPARVGSESTGAVATPRTGDARSDVPAELMVFREHWTAAGSAVAAAAFPRRVLCIVPDDAFADAVAEALGDVELIFIVAGDDVVRPDTRRYAARCDDVERVQQALAAAGQAHGAVDALVYAAGLGAAAGEQDWRGLLGVVRGLAGSRLEVGRVLFCGCYDDALSRSHVESWIGLQRSLRVLMPGLPAAVLMQQGALRDADAVRAWTRRVWGELCAASPCNVRYEGDDRYELRVREHTLPAVDEPPRETGLRHGGVYWITGGAGGLGAMLARHLQDRYGAKVVLSGRSALDPSRLAEIGASAHGDVMYVAADVADAAAMRAGVAAAVSRFGAVDGVIHAAGVLEAGTLLDRSPQASARVLSPKVRGTQVLDEAFADQPLRFVCYFSSSSGVLGDFGSADYAIGNRFEMAYADCAQGRFKRVAIAWPVWADGGMQADDAANTQLYLQASGQRALSSATGMAIFERLLGEAGGHYLVMNGRRDRIEQTLGLRAASTAVDAAPTAPAGARRRPELRGLTVEQCVLWDLKQQVGDLLKLSREQIQAQENLADYGFDSITLAQWARQISAHYAIEVTPAVFFSHASLEKVAAFLLAAHRERIEQCYGESEAVAESPAPTASAATRQAPRSRRLVASLPRSAEPSSHEPIAIIGMSGRFPEARTVEDMWRILAEGRSAITEIALERFDWREGFASGLLKSKWLGAMPGVDEFDPLFFEIAPRDAQTMDPRQRLLLQEAWNALEDAAYGEAQLQRHTVGVFVGVEQGEYHLLVGEQGTLTGTHEAILASRLSYFLNLRGPAMAINTSCSSGLVAAHQACLSLRAGECDTAIAAGASVSLTAQTYIGMGQAGMLSPDGRCYAFDARANGMVPGEAVVAVVLKRLSQAEADGDPIHAVIRASGINYDGKTNGITAPNGASQAELIRSVFAQARVKPDDVDYVVTHGTGTPLGDPVEFNALREVFGARTGADAQCSIISTKSNFGHTFAASGLLSLVAAVLSLRHETIPASVNWMQPSNYADWQDSALKVNADSQPWPRSAVRARIAGVSAFGMSGTNAHLVLEDYRARETPAKALPMVPLVLSAKSTEALQRKVSELIDLLSRREWTAGALTAMSHTLLCGRQHFAHRCAVVAEDGDNALHLLRQLQTGERLPNLFRGVVPREFAGQAALTEYAHDLFERLGAGGLTPLRQQEALYALTDLYCQGYALPWVRLFGPEPPRRIALPTYPFERQRYWVEPLAPRSPAGVTATAAAVVADAPEATAVAPDEAPVGTLTLVPSWELSPVERVPAPAVPSGRWLLVEDDANQHAELRAQYPDSILIGAGDATVESLAAQLTALGPIDEVVWRVPPARLDAGGDALIAGQEQGVLRGLTLLQALLHAGYGERSLALTVITQQAQAVVPGERIDATHASVWGLIGSAAKEQAAWQVRLVDVETAAERTALIRMCRERAPDPHGNGRARRGGRWYRPVCVPCTLPAVTSPAYRQGGVYVLVGGAGGVGELLSEQLIRQYRARVIWLGRRERDAAIEAKQARLAQWGDAPEYLAVDARDAAALRSARDTILARHGEIHGVVHAALVMSGSELAQMSAERFRAGLSAKVDVSVRLVEAFAGAVQDFVVFFSSIQALEKTRRQSNYAAGSTFVDAFATQAREQFGCAVKVVDWGYWAGMGVALLSSFQHWLAEAGMDTIEAAEGLDALERVLGSPLDHVAYLKTQRADALQGVRFARDRIAVDASAPAMREVLAAYEAPAFAASAEHDSAVEWMRPLQALLLQVLLHRLQEIGPADATAVTTLEEWRAQSSLLPEYTRWWHQSVRLLSAELGGEAALLDALRHPDAAQREAVLAQWAQTVDAARGDAQWWSHMHLVESTVAVLPQILRGEQAATAVMFPQATMQRVQGAYRGNALTDYCNAVLAQVLRRYVAARLAQDPAAQLRIIEIGAGTGGTSAVVFEALQDYAAHIAEYAYTDVSKAFLHHAQERYAPTTPYLRGQVFDAERAPDEQGIATNHYDVAISTNAIHATREIRHALRHMKSALRGNGVLLLNELSGNASVLSHLTFGLLDGWWRFEDEALREPGCPLLAPERWQQALAAEGFEAIRFVTPQLHAKTQVIVAHSDGVARLAPRVRAPVAVPAAAVPQTAAKSPAVATSAPRVSTQLLHEHVRQAVLENVSASLMIDVPLINADVSFAEYGLDSLLAVRTIEALNAALGIRLTSTSLFDFSTVNKLTAHIAQAYREPLTAALGVATSVAVEPLPQRVESAAPAAGAPRVSTQLLLEHVRQAVLENVAASLMIDVPLIDADVSFAEYGLDSLLAVRTIEALNAALGIRLTSTSLFDFSTVNKLTAHIAQAYREPLTAALGGVGTAAPAEPLRARGEPAVQSAPEPGLRAPLAVDSQHPPAIAIVGISGRYPRSPDVDTLWTHLQAGDDLTQPVTRWNLGAEPYCPRGGFLDHIDQFDASFFNISGVEATHMDPQQRLFLQESWNALEDAGYVGAAIAGRRCGVYAGYNGGDYNLLATGPTPPQALWGSATSLVSARIAYYLDLQGPAITVDTACSSSLVAIHLASQALRTGEVELALAGGVYVQCTPILYLGGERAGMLSANGRCYTFDDRADGFVPGEGVGAVVLKRLDDALADGDHVYGVIRGSGINQDGATNGITAPSAASQERLERDVYDRFGISADEIELVEAHGTGTKLGDPIEFHALTRAFRQDTQREGYCAIGSIKTNIGHTTAASGVAGVLKVLLCLKHRQIVPSLNFAQSNRHIEFAGSPFYVPTQVRDWPAAPGRRRCAAVSSFGLSGTNAHVVIEEAPATERRPAPRPGYLVVLSARSAAQLKQQAQQLIDHAGQQADLDLGNVSYTLLMGRKHFEHRLACVVRNGAELAARLQTWVTHGKAPQVYASRITQLEGGGQAGLRRYGQQCMHDCVPSLAVDDYLERLATIADLHVQGYDLDYAPLFASQPHARLSLPTYPFATTTYWVESGAAMTTSATGARAMLHPLVQENTSDVDELRFSSVIGAEAEHVEHGMLTSVAQLEMARAALAHGAGWTTDDGAALLLHDVQWGEPVVVGDRVHIGLYVQADGAIDYEIYSERSDGERTVHGMGRGERSMVSAATMDDAAVRVPLDLPDTRSDDRYVLHPALLQQLVRAVPQLVGAHDGAWALRSVRRVDVLAALRESGEARLHAIARNDDGSYRCHVQLCDAQQRVCAVLHDLAFSPASTDEPVPTAASLPASPALPREPTTLMTLQERWVEQASTPGASRPKRVLCVAADAALAQHIALAWRTHDSDLEVIQVWFADAVESVAPDRHAVVRDDTTSCRQALASIAQHYGAVDALVYAGQVDEPTGEDGWRALLPLLQGLFASGLSCGRLLLSAAYADALSRCHAESWIGIERSLRVLVPSLPVAVLLQPSPADVPQWAQRVWQELCAESLRSVRYDADRRWVLQAQEQPLTTAASALRRGGVYWITGGAGGLGALVARHLLERYAAKVVLSGRRELDDARQAELQAWTRDGGEVLYIAADVADTAAMRHAVTQAVERFGAIEGVIHAAGVLEGGSLLDKQADAFARVLAPKVRGTQVLDAVLQDQPLAFVCYFSSSAAVIGDFGSGDYAMGNRFEMAYAEHVAGPGQRIAINWPVWADSGMQLGDAANTAPYLKASGHAALTAEAGLEVLERLLGQSGGHCLVMVGQRSRIERTLGLRGPSQNAAPAPAAVAPAVPSRRRAELRGLPLEDCVQWELKAQIGELLKLHRDQIQAQENLADYGFDSITMAQWAKQISAHYAIELTPAVFFSHATLERVVAYLLEHHRASVEARYRETEPAAAPAPRALSARRAPSAPLRSRRVASVDTAAARSAEPIAIIGMSGRFPQARSVDALWRILAEGRSAVAEVPLERFDWRAGYAAGVLKSKWLGAMPGVEEFDPAFFEISPREAQVMDPRQRLLLQEAWNALEDAGYGTLQLARHTVGMFVGVEQGEYQGMVGAHGSLTGTHDAILASRLSYFLNLHGPAMAINTSCSSGLVAAHQACLSLHAGECDTAIAASASMSLLAESFGAMSQAGMLSDDGRCYAFDRRANGMVPGEAVVALVFKRLSQAQADGDPVRAVILGSGINYDGKTNGITAPNGALQAALIRDVYARAGVAPGQIDYVVTHGTGTRLGDPVEIDALREVFGARAGRAAPCAITSTKSNLGHAFAASGLVSLVSAVLALTHEQIPPSLNCEEPSDYIDWQDCALEVNRAPKPWPRTPGRSRMVGISAFGMSGTNAHMLVQEPAPAERPVRLLRPVPLMLSARSAEALQQKIDDLMAVLRQGAVDAGMLTAMSYTLLCGRQHFTHRCALVVEDREHALQLLSQARAGERLPNVFRGVAPREFAGQRSLLQYGEALLAQLASGASDDAAARDALHALADLYCQGYALPWATLFGTAPPRRLALPTYPFARERYWIEGLDEPRAPGLGNAEIPAAAIHPLLQRNTSTLSTQRFTSTFNGREPHLGDHRVGGTPTLAGVCYLEMAHAALRASAEGEAGEGPIELRDVVWVRPLAVTGTVEVHTRLYEARVGEVAFDICTATPGGDDVAILAQGRLLRIDETGDRLDIDRLRARCDRTLDADSCYALLNGSVLEYGAWFRGLVSLHLCDAAAAPFVLAQVQLPPCALDGADRYALHPCVLDSALQAAVGLRLLASLRDSAALGSLPFAVESVRVLAPTPRVAWAFVRMAADDARHTASTIDVDVCDENGRVCVAVRGLSLLASKSQPDIEPALPATVRTEFRGHEFFLEDHNHVVPGVVYLTLARDAGERDRHRRVVGLVDVVWRTPMTVTPTASALVTRLAPAGSFTIASESDAICAQGTLILDNEAPQPSAARHDLDAIRDRCADRIEGHLCHELLGVVHGPRMFPIENIAFGEREALARLVRQNAPDDADALHPATLHGAVLSAIAYSFIQDGRPAQLRLPFALDALWIHVPALPATAYAYVRQRSADGAPVRTYDIDIVAETGECLVAFEGFTALPVDLPAADAALRAVPVWQDRPLQAPADAAPADALLFVLAVDDAALRRDLLAQWPAARIEVLDQEPSGVRPVSRFMAVMALLQDCLRTPLATTRILVLCPDDEQYPTCAPIAGLLRTARVEHARLAGTLIAYAPDAPAALLDRLRAEVGHADGEVVVRYRDGARQVVRWQELDAPTAVHTDPTGLLQAGDVVWITGGLGGIGRILARWFGRIDGVRVLLSGRSPVGESGQQWLDAARQDGVDVTYLRCDVSRREDVAAVLAGDAVQGRLRGIVQCAGTLRDAYLARKTTDEVQAVFAPKIDGTLNLDEATRDVPLAFFALFSSLAAVLGNPGQADYAGANAFLDAFAVQRNALVARGARSGHTCSINWPLWQDGGMHVDAQTVQLTRLATGLAPLDSEYALRAFASALHERHAQMLVAQGQLDAIRVAVLGTAAMATRAAAVAPAAPAARIDEAAPTDAALTRRLVRELADCAAGVLKLPADRIDEDTELSHYGFDSIYLTEFANHLNRAYALRLMPTVFFECPTLVALARHLLARHGAELRAHWTVDATASAPHAPRTAVAPARRGRPAAAVRPPQPAPGSAPHAREPIAVVGMSGRFPGSASVDAFWAHLADNHDLIGTVPPQRWAWMRGIGANPAALPEPVKLGGFIADVDCFDPLFFGIAPLEAVAMDPQQRLFIETAWACIEDAGYRPGSLAGSRTGVFVGVSTSDYKDLCQLAGASLQLGGDSAFHYMIANRLSYLLDLRGPSEPVDTACSSSLVALHRAVGALASGDCEIALVGGVNVIASPVNSVRAYDNGILSSDGRCKTFDQSADGYGRGEGVAVLMLKPLRRAQADHDHIYGLVRASAENHGGRAASHSAPNPLAQQQLLLDAYQAADVDIRTVGYIEAHGTGTVLGDPIEFNALKAAFGELYRRQGVEAPAQPHCVLGSVKSNIGHLEAAAGVAGVIKVLMMMRHGRIPGNPLLTTPNRYLEFEDGPFRLARETGEWAAPRDAAGGVAPRRAGVSSFGIGGANAHVVLEEYRAPTGHAPPSTAPALIVVSARTRERLVASARQLLLALECRDDSQLHDIAYTLQVGREPMEHRLAFVVASMRELCDKLNRYLQGQPHGGYENEAGRNSKLFGSLAGEQALALTVDTWVRQGEYARLAELWSTGLPFDWQRLYDDSAVHAALSPRRVSLPTYPFARERYWVETGDGRQPPAEERMRHRGDAATQDDATLEQLLDGLLANRVTLQDALQALERTEEHS